MIPPKQESPQVSHVTLTDTTTTNLTTITAANKRYFGDLFNCEDYIDAAFRSSQTNEAYLFMEYEYVVLNYMQDTIDNKYLDEPLLIGDLYPSLRGTCFTGCGIDCGFRSAWDEKEEFIFSGSLCVRINVHEGLQRGPMTIISMFPFLKKTMFGHNLDAAFESTKEPEAYLFKGNQYALINYGTDGCLIRSGLITERFPSLRGTLFESGIDAAFASHKDNEAYIFKEDSYALINVPTGSIIGGVNKILHNWSSLRSILPRSGGADFPVYKRIDGGRDQEDYPEEDYPESDSDHCKN